MDDILYLVGIIIEICQDKLGIIPYAIRQFCKCLFQAAKDKF